jgi:hypothetical protein
VVIFQKDVFELEIAMSGIEWFLAYPDVTMSPLEMDIHLFPISEFLE